MPDDSQPIEQAEARFSPAEEITLSYWFVKVILPSLDEDIGSSQTTYDPRFNFSRPDNEDDESGFVPPAAKDGVAAAERTRQELMQEARDLMRDTKSQLDVLGFSYFEAQDLREYFSTRVPGTRAQYLNDNDDAEADFLIVAIPLVTAEWKTDPDRPNTINNLMWETISALVARSSVNAEGEIEEVEDSEPFLSIQPMPDDVLPEDLSSAEIMDRIKASAKSMKSPRQGETEAEWLRRVVVTEEAVTERWEDWISVGCNAEYFAKQEPPSAMPDAVQTPEFLVDGLIQKATLHLFIAAAGTGKSTSLAELAVAVAEGGDRTWLGRSINATERKGKVIYVAGEDNIGTVNKWRSTFDNKSRNLLPIEQNTQSLTDLIATFDNFPAVALLIIDSGRLYLDGGEMNDEAVNEFYLILTRFIKRTGTAVIITHHLTKDAEPKSLNDFKSLTRGLQLWIDRARIAIGMWRSGQHTKIGIFKHNVPAGIPTMSETAFEFDPNTYQLVPVIESEGRSDATSANQVLVLGQIRRLNVETVKVFKTGDRGLYVLAKEQLPGLARDTVADIVGDLIALGVVTSDPVEGLRSAVPEAASVTPGEPER